MRAHASAVPPLAPSRTGRWTALARWLPGLTVWAAALAVWPGLEAPFSTAKTVVLAAGAAGLVASVLLRGRARAIPWVALAGGLALALASIAGGFVGTPSLALHASAATLLIAGCAAGVDAPRLARSAAGAGAVVAAVTLLQSLGADLLATFGPRVTGSRLALYGTLGNPDFVAAFVGASLWPAAWAWREAQGRTRLGWTLAIALHAGALVATRSFASLLALAAVGSALLWAARRSRSAQGWRTAAGVTERGASARSLEPTTRHVRLAALAALALAGALVFSVQGRALDRLVAGRVHLWQVAAPAVLDAPLAGHGPGAVERLWPAWQAVQAELSRSEPAFAALQNHAHNDFLERALEQGAPGLLALLALLAVVLRRGLRSLEPAAVALTCAVASLAARALVDFPLSRPAELALFSLACAAVLTTPSPKEPS